MRKIDLTETESLEIVNVHLKEKLAEQQLSFEREKKEILFKRIIDKYGIKTRAELSPDGRSLLFPDAVLEEAKPSVPVVEKLETEDVKKKKRKND